MKESVTYQAIVEEGELREARKMVLRVAARRLGEAPAAAQAALEAICNLATLEGLVDRVFEVETWDELLQSLA